ncbi:MAG: TIM barrel protein [Candidatus Absconditabacteria bacterium]
MADIFFEMEEQTTVQKEESTTEKPKESVKFLVSTDSFSNCGLDMIFDLAKEAGFDGIDLAIRKSNDCRNVEYMKKLSIKHEMPVKSIQVSENVNEKELNKALDLCEATGADTIAINAPKFFNIKSFNFLVDNLDTYKKENRHIHFSIINPADASIFALPIPQYRFSNIVEIIKKYGCYLGLDISNLKSDVLENDFMRKITNFLPYISIIYLSDKNRVGDSHLLPGEGTLKLESFLKKVKQGKYARYFSTKINIKKADLADSEKIASILKKARKYYTEYFEEIDITTK